MSTRAERKARRNKSRCVNCGEFGRHKIPVAGMGYICKKKEIPLIKGDRNIERGVAVTSSYCYACSDPIVKGDIWRQERVGYGFPQGTRIIHDVCPKDREPTYEDMALKALTNPDYRQGLLDAARVAKAQGTDLSKPPCPSEMVATYLERLANGRLL